MHFTAFVGSRWTLNLGLDVQHSGSLRHIWVFRQRDDTPIRFRHSISTKSQTTLLTFLAFGLRLFSILYYYVVPLCDMRSKARIFFEDGRCDTTRPWLRAAFRDIRFSETSLRARPGNHFSQNPSMGRGFSEPCDTPILILLIRSLQSHLSALRIESSGRLRPPYLCPISVRQMLHCQAAISRLMSGSTGVEKRSPNRHETVENCLPDRPLCTAFTSAHHPDILGVVG